MADIGMDIGTDIGEDIMMDIMVILIILHIGNIPIPIIPFMVHVGC